MVPWFGLLLPPTPYAPFLQKNSLHTTRQGVAATVNLEPEGMRFRGISWLKPNSTQKYQVENKTNTLARRLPADTLMMFSGGNLSRFWQDNAQNADSNPLSIISPIMSVQA
jgi:hypothetical protein